MVKKRKVRENNQNATKHGHKSKFLAEIKERLELSALDKVTKMELDNMFSEIVARSIALDVDSYVNRLLIERIKSLDPKIVEYEMDLYSTQAKLSDLEREQQFHRKVVLDLKEQYLSETDPNKRLQILDEIDKREDAIKKHQNNFLKLIDLRNKIRKELDKKDYLKKSVELKEKAFEDKVIDIGSIEMNDVYPSKQ